MFSTTITNSITYNIVRTVGRRIFYWWKFDIWRKRTCPIYARQISFGPVHVHASSARVQPFRRNSYACKLRIGFHQTDYRPWHVEHIRYLRKQKLRKVQLLCWRMFLVLTDFEAGDSNYVVSFSVLLINLALLIIVLLRTLIHGEPFIERHGKEATLYWRQKNQADYDLNNVIYTLLEVVFSRRIWFYICAAVNVFLCLMLCSFFFFAPPH